MQFEECFKGVGMKNFVIAICVGLLLFVASNVTAQIVDDFYITIGTSCEIVTGGGSGYNEGMWYEYDSGWINEWFYDHQFDPNRGKVIHIEFDLVVLDPANSSNLCFAVNWSTPEWSGLGYGTDYPPIPGVTGFIEAEHIERETLLTACPVPVVTTHYIFDYIIYDYNPEWVSIDVMGVNFEITNGVITHDCVVASREESWGAIKSMYR